VLLDKAQLWLERGEHVSLVGPNGSGKTTLIETLTAQRPLAAGKLRTGHNVTVGYLSQHGDELGSSGTVLAATQRATGLTPNKARALLGRFLFSGELAEKPLAGCSGGETPQTLARDPGERRRERADPRRADQPPRPRVARGARGCPERVWWLADPGLPRPGAARRGRDTDDRGRARHAAQLCRRLAGVRARTRGAQGGGARISVCPRAAARAPRRRRPAARPLPSSSRSGVRRRRRDRARTACATRRRPNSRSRRRRQRWSRWSSSCPIRRRGRRSTRRPRNEARHTAAKAGRRGRLRGARSGAVAPIRDRLAQLRRLAIGADAPSSDELPQR